MSKGPGGFTVTVKCMIISGFPGIGKTHCFNEFKKQNIFAKVQDMDVRNYGTTNGINVADPAEYVRQVKALSEENDIIFVTCDREVRMKLCEAELFYIVIAPEFPPQLGNRIPGYRPDALMRAMYMKRFTEKLGSNTLAGETLSGRGYEDAIVDIFSDPMPHIVAPVLNRQIVDQAWNMIDQLTRQTIGANQLMGMAGVPQPPMPHPDLGGKPNLKLIK